MSKSQSKEFFKKKQRSGYQKNPSTTSSVITNATPTKLYHVQTSYGSATGLIGNGEDPAVVVINQCPPTTHRTKEKRTKICCLL